MSKETIYIPNNDHNHISVMDRYNEEMEKYDYLTIRLIYSYHEYSEGYWIEFDKNYHQTAPFESILRSYDNRVKYRDDQISKIFLNE